MFSSFLYPINKLIKRHATNYQKDTEVALNKIQHASTMPKHNSAVDHDKNSKR